MYIYDLVYIYVNKHTRARARAHTHTHTHTHTHIHTQDFIFKLYKIEISIFFNIFVLLCST